MDELNEITRANTLWRAVVNIRSACFSQVELMAYIDSSDASEIVNWRYERVSSVSHCLTLIGGTYEQWILRRVENLMKYACDGEHWDVEVYTDRVRWYKGGTLRASRIDS